MSLVRGANYSQAGIHATLSDAFDVRDSVRIAGATAGACQPIYEGDEADERFRQRAWQPGFTFLQAAICLGVVLAVLFSVYVIRQKELTRLAIEVNQMNDSINQLVAENAVLDAKILHQKESDRIDYEAIQVLGMVHQDETEIYSIYAPNPRPYERKTVISAAGR